MNDADIFDAASRAKQKTAMSVDLTAAERLTELYETHREELYRFLVGQGIESAKAQELAQDVFVKLLVAIRDKTAGTKGISAPKGLMSSNDSRISGFLF